MRILTILLLLNFIYFSQADQTYSSTFSFVQTNVFTKSIDKNALYAVGTSDYKIYRMNYTRNLYTVTFNFSTTHTKKVRVITLSYGETYVATGSEDYSIQVAQVFTKTKICKLINYNQVRALVFHPKYQQILYSGSVDDVIRKWNISNCSQIAQKSIGGSVHSLAISPDGNALVFGTLQGHVGMIDQNLGSFNITTNAHYFTVLYVYYTYPGYYISIGDDSMAILWYQGTYVANFTSLLYTRIFNCFMLNLIAPTQDGKYFCCYSLQNNYVATYKVTNSTIFRFTTHGFSSYSSINWVDMRSLNPQEQIWLISYGSNLVMDNIHDANSSVCTDHFAKDLTIKTCRFCGYMLPGCHFCDDSNKCTTCGIGTYSASNKCYKCPQHCANCNSATNCNTCAVGWAPLGSTGTCKAVTPNGCFLYSNNGVNCNTAGNGYYINSGNQARPCSNSDVGCLQCVQSSSATCLTCKTGYFLSSGNCVSCAASMPGCLACANSNTCLKCAVAYKMNGAYLQCSNCAGSCPTCSYWYDDCLTCSSSQNRVMQNFKCKCMDGYYDTGSTTNYTCALCSSVLTNCYKCNNNNVCTQCKTNYYLKTAAGKTQCTLCTAECETCEGTYTNCTSCNSYYNRVLSGSSCVCLNGYVSVTNSVPCLSCSGLNEGCLNCANQTYCTSCDTGYYLVKTNSSYQLCSPCPYYCPSCSVNATGDMICNSCPAGSFRTLTGDSCPCDSGYFDDNHTAVCEKCSDVLSNCLTCNNRTKCLSCAPGMYTDQAHTLCTTCLVTCATCGTYFDTCTSCDPATNRVLDNQKCVCQSNTYQSNNACLLCSNVIPNCNSCQNPYSCTGCLSGYTLQEDLKGCINCQAEINGCLTCSTATNCTGCKAPFTLINQKCRCPLNQYTDKSIWGSCKDYPVQGLKSSLGVQLQVHQHQNNTLIVFIRFRAKVLTVVNKQVQQSIEMSINGISVPIKFDYISNNHVKISTELNETLLNPTITVTFDTTVFYNEYLLPLANANQTIKVRRAYYYTQSQIKSYTAIYNVLKYTFYVFKWVFFGVTLIGQGHLLFPFVIFIQLMPLFLMLNIALPASLSMILDAMLSFQIKSVIPLLDISSNFVVTFPPMTYDYYGLNDFFLFGKIGDLLMLVLVNVLTKFDQGFVRMFPPGRIRRYIYQSLVRRGYAVMSLCILSLQPSFILLAGVYVGFNEWESSQEIFNYCCCVFAFGFYLAYNFNHASNLQGSKLMKNIQNQQCFLDLNPQESVVSKITLFVLVVDFWMIGSLHLVSPMVYFISCLLFLAIKIIIHIKTNLYIGKIQFALRTLSNLFLFGIFCMMMIMYLSESQINLPFNVIQTLGIVTTAFMLCYLFFYIIQKIVFNLKLQSEFIQAKVVNGKNGQQNIFENPNAQQNGDQKQPQESDRSHKIREFLTNTSKDGGFSALNFRNKNTNRKEQQKEKSQANYPMESSRVGTLNNGFNGNNGKTERANFGNRSEIKKPTVGFVSGVGGTQTNDNFFRNQSSVNHDQQNIKTEKQLRIKNTNTSKYARNHLQLRYKAQGILTTKKTIPDQEDHQI